MTDTDLVKYIVVEFASADVGGRKLVRLLCEPGAGRSRSDLVSGSGLRPFFLHVFRNELGLKWNSDWGPVF